jgi:hypothetical protein
LNEPNREGEAPAEPLSQFGFHSQLRLSGSFALPFIPESLHPRVPGL